jgi:Glu-tRNA(Gln) amidotransferase subunit E-like FAD-binding protein
LGVTRDDALIVVWGAEDDTITAAEEIRLRYADAVEGIPNETRQPFADGSTDFERILPGPDRMYPDTDSPPQRITRERVRALQVALPAPPWEREQRYAAAGVPRTTIHYLIRRGGARLVDEVVESCNADLRRAAFFFGERMRGLQRAGLVANEISIDRWRELFTLLEQYPVLWEAWKQIVSLMALRTNVAVSAIVEEEGLGTEPQGWRERLRGMVQLERPDHPDGSLGQRARYLVGKAMADVRGRVPVAEVAEMINAQLEVER